MINDLLDNQIGLQNFGWNGYQPPLTKLSAQVPDRPGLHPGEPHERRGRAGATSTSGLTFYEVSPSTEALWRDNWARFKAGA